jgi:hypothetical protein
LIDELYSLKARSFLSPVEVLLVELWRGCNQGRHYDEQCEPHHKSEYIDRAEPRLGVFVAESYRNSLVGHVEDGVVLSKELFAQHIFIANIKMEATVVQFIVAFVQ